LEADGFRVLLDLGAGALGELAKHTDIYGIDAMVLSHLHPDHCIDMCGYYVARNYRPPASRCGGRRARPAGWPPPTGCPRTPA
jgi:ribonuclease BN (tRNA processing enzyme)